MPRRQRAQARRAVRPEVDLRVRLRGAALETRRRLRPARCAGGFAVRLDRPQVTRTLLFAIQLIAALIALLLEVRCLPSAGLARAWSTAAIVTGEMLRRHVKPRSTVAFVGIAAAIGLGVSQFFDYHGVVVDAPATPGSSAQRCPAPITARETAGSAHLWILLPVAAAAIGLIVAAYGGRPRLAAAVSVCGVLGIAVALAVDVPQGLNAGRAGLAFNGTQAELLQGFWAEVACSAVLILCGGLLAHYSRGASRRRQQRRDGQRGGRRPRSKEVGGISPGLQAESVRGSPGPRPCSCSPARPEPRCSASRSSPTSST